MAEIPLLEWDQDTPEYSDITLSMSGAIVGIVHNADSFACIEGTEVDFDAHTRAFADKICRAVNLHEELVAALTDLLERVDAVNEAAGEYDPDPFPASLVFKAREVLAKAKK